MIHSALLGRLFIADFMGRLFIAYFLFSIFPVNEFRCEQLKEVAPI